MRDVFLTVLTLSVSGSLILLLMLLLRPLLKKRTSKAWQYYIWVIVILRLLLPFAPEHNLMEMVAGQAYIHSSDGQEPVEFLPNTPVALPLPDAELQDAPGWNREMNDTPTDSPVPPTIGIIELAGRIWLAAATVLFLGKLLSYLLFVRRAKAWCTPMQDGAVTALYREVCEEMRIRRLPALTGNSILPAPALLGTLRPVIALPDTNLGEEQLRHILRHELTHYKRWDIAYKWLVQAAVCLHWFNPLVHLLSREINRLCELSCDEEVISGLDKAGMRAYGDMLLESIQSGINPPSRATVSITLCEDKKLVKERLESIMQYKKKSKLSVASSALLAAALFIGASYTGAYAAGQPAATVIAEDTRAAQPEFPPETPDAPAVQPQTPTAAQVSTAGCGEIVKSLSADGIQNIEIYAELCTLVVEPSATGQFEVSFAYPEAARVNYNNHFDLDVAKSGNTIAISTDYENQRWDTTFEEIDGFDSSRYASESILTVKVPQKQFATLRVTLNVTGSTFTLSGVDASELGIYNATGNMVVKADRAYDNLSFENNVGNVTLQLPSLSGRLDISNRIGHFVLALPQEPGDILLTATDMTGNGYDVNYFLPDSMLMVRGDEVDSYQRGSGSCQVNVGLTNTSGFELMIGGVSNLD